MNTNVLMENAGGVVKDSLILEAKRFGVSHQPPLTLDDWKKQRAELVSLIKANAGAFPVACDLDIKYYESIQMSGYSITKLTYQSRPGFRVTANLYVPDGPGPYPGVLNLHGHWAQGKCAERVQNRGHLLALNGFVVLTVDAFGAGERGTIPGEFEYHGAGIGGSLFAIGETLLGMQVNDNMRGIDLLQSLDYVDADRIGVTGASGGGNQTMWVSTLDERVKASVPVVSVGTFESYVTGSNCICELLPNGLTFTEEWGILGLAAPNPMLILNAMQDSNPTFYVSEMTRSFNSAREIYKLYGEMDKFSYQAINLTHGYWPDMLQCMLGWFLRWLKDEGEGRPVEIQAHESLSESQCLCFPDNRRPADVSSIFGFVRPRAQRLAANHLSPGNSIDAAQKRAELKGILNVPAGPDYVSISRVREGAEGNLSIAKFSVEIEQGIPVPVFALSKSGVKEKETVIAVHPDGKDAAWNDPRVQSALDSGKTVVLADLRGTGETHWDNIPIHDQPHHCSARAVLWLGRTTIGDWTKDILGVASCIKDVLSAKNVEIISCGETGLAALSASVLSEKIKSVYAAGVPGSYVNDSDKVRLSMAVHIPGILKWGDVSMMAALSNAGVEITEPVDWGGAVYSKEQALRLQENIDALTKKAGLIGHAKVNKD